MTKQESVCNRYRERYQGEFHEILAGCPGTRRYESKSEAIRILHNVNEYLDTKIQREARFCELCGWFHLTSERK